MPASSGLETARVVHSFLEHWALGFFLAVVACDTILPFLEEPTRFVWVLGWQRQVVTLFKRQVTIRPFRDTVSIRRLIKILSLLGFAVAIGLEILALPYSDQIDELSDKELTMSQRQTMAALRISSAANERAGIAEQKATKNEREAAAFRWQAAVLIKRAADERLARVKIEEKLAGWNLDADSQTRLTEILTPFRETPFDLVSDPSESRFTREINDVLMVAGWNRLPPLDPTGHPYTVFVGVAGAYTGTPGITIEMARDSFDRFGEAFSALSKALIAVGIPAKTNIVRAGEGDARAIHIIIGKR